MWSASSSARCTRILPASKWLASYHCTCCCACLPVDINYSSFNIIKECAKLFLIVAKDSRSKAIVCIVCKLDRIVKLVIIGHTENWHKHLFFEEPMLGWQADNNCGFDIIAML